MKEGERKEREREGERERESRKQTKKTPKAIKRTTTLFARAVFFPPLAFFRCASYLSLRVNFDEYFLFSHDFHDFPYVRSWLLQELEFLLEKTHAEVQLVPLSFEPPQVVGLISNLDL